ncbi:hypothetical protein ABBQ32_011124 [Trebouxia sp. C0010 RCD-2024]
MELHMSKESSLGKLALTQIKASPSELTSVYPVEQDFIQAAVWKCLCASLQALAVQGNSFQFNCSTLQAATAEGEVKLKGGDL